MPIESHWHAVPLATVRDFALALWLTIGLAGNGGAADAPKPADVRPPSASAETRSEPPQDRAASLRRGRTAERRAPSGKSAVSADRSVSFPADI